MKPEDLGIAGFVPEPDPPPRPKPGAVTAELVRSAEDARLKVRALATVAEAVGQENVALRGAYDRSQVTIQRAAVELFHVKRALEEARRHRAILFWIGLVLFLFLLLK